MLLRLLLAFTVIPLIELALLLEVGSWLGLGPTIALVLTTGAVGAWLARAEGIRAIKAIQDEAAAGRVPGDQLIQGFLILVAGIVLITPGVLTDLAGILLLLRPIRSVVARRLKRSFADSLKVVSVSPFGSFTDPVHPTEGDSGRVIEI